MVSFTCKHTLFTDVDCGGLAVNDTLLVDGPATDPDGLFPSLPPAALHLIEKETNQTHCIKYREDFWRHLDGDYSLQFHSNYKESQISQLTWYQFKLIRKFSFKLIPTQLKNLIFLYNSLLVKYLLTNRYWIFESTVWTDILTNTDVHRWNCYSSCNEYTHMVVETNENLNLRHCEAHKQTHFFFIKTIVFQLNLL